MVLLSRAAGISHRLPWAARRTLLLLLAGVVGSLVELIVLGRLTPPMLALDVVGGSTFAVGLLSGLAVLAPPGTLPRIKVDWRQFELDFAAYVRLNEATG